MKQIELEAVLSELEKQMGIDGLRDELAEYFETAGTGGRKQLQTLSDNAVRNLYVCK